MVEKTFIVVTVESAFNGIFIYLKPSELPILSSPLERALTPQRESEDAKIAREMMQGVMQEVKRTLAPDMMMIDMPRPFVVRIYLTQSEYEELHKPTVGDTIQMQLQRQKEGEQVEGKSAET